MAQQQILARVTARVTPTHTHAHDAFVFYMKRPRVVWPPVEHDIITLACSGYLYGTRYATTQLVA